MGFNGIEGITNVPGQVPWEMIVIYFAAALIAVFAIGKRGGGLRVFSTMDLVYIGIGAAFAVVWEFYIGSFLNRGIPAGLSNFVDMSFFGRIFILFIVAALVRKVGVGMISLAIFNLLSDIFFYGFGGEPIFTFYEALTYGLFLDLAIAFSKGNLFGVKGPMSFASMFRLNIASPSVRPVQAASIGVQSSKMDVQSGGLMLSPRTLAIVGGAVIGLLWAFSEPIFYDAFFSPLLYGSVVGWGKILFSLGASIPGNIIVGILAALSALRISRAV
jgi:hypothetical protein